MHPATEAKILSREFWTVEEAAELLRCNPNTLLRRIRSGKLPAIQPVQGYLICAGDLLEHIQRKLVAA